MAASPGDAFAVTYTGVASGGVTTDAGTNLGPSGDARIDGANNIIAGKWVFDVGTVGTTPALKFGKTDTASTDNTITTTDVTALAINQIVSEDNDEIPDNTEFFQYGFGEQTASTITTLNEVWTFVLHLPVAIVRRVIVIS